MWFVSCLFLELINKKDYSAEEKSHLTKIIYTYSSIRINTSLASLIIFVLVICFFSFISCRFHFENMAGRPQRPQYIVDHFDEFLDNYNAHSLSIATADTLSTIKWLAGKRLLRNSYL
jgi:F0F1-type ATP synthase membrane subunit a